MSNNDTKIKTLLEKVEEQQAGLGTKPRAGWHTNGIFKYTDGNYFNLNTVNDFQILVKALSFLLKTESLASQAAAGSALFRACGRPRCGGVPFSGLPRQRIHESRVGGGLRCCRIVLGLEGARR